MRIDIAKLVEKAAEGNAKIYIRPYDPLGVGVELARGDQSVIDYDLVKNLSNPHEMCYKTPIENCISRMFFWLDHPDQYEEYRNSLVNAFNYVEELMGGHLFLHYAKIEETNKADIEIKENNGTQERGVKRN